jgi:lipopolysaccharide transport system permease protein
MFQHRALIVKFTKREIESRYRGTIFGVFWTFLQPLLMLAIYATVFGAILKVRWSQDDGGSTEFVFALFIGLIVHGFLSEVLSKAPMLVVSNASYVKKVIFPIQIFPIVSVLGALFFFLAALLLWIAAFYFYSSELGLTILYAPVIFLPLIITAIGLSWIISALGVYIRDLSQLMGMLTTAMLFLSPVFYPISNLPEFLQMILYFNPITIIILELRNTMMLGLVPNWESVLLSYVASIFYFGLGYLLFSKAKRGFADVL